MEIRLCVLRSWVQFLALYGTMWLIVGVIRKIKIKVASDIFLCGENKVDTCLRNSIFTYWHKFTNIPDLEDNYFPMKRKGRHMNSNRGQFISLSTLLESVLSTLLKLVQEKHTKADIQPWKSHSPKWINVLPSVVVNYFVYSNEAA